MTKSDEYKRVAKMFGVKLRFSRWGVLFFTKRPDGKLKKVIEVVPLDHWYSVDEQESEEMMKELTLEATKREQEGLNQ